MRLNTLSAVRHTEVRAASKMLASPDRTDFAHQHRSLTRVEAGSNTSTVTLRVIGGDEMGSLKSETVKYEKA
jgi:hypothetical protein